MKTSDTGRVIAPPGARLLVVHGQPQGKTILFRPGEFLFGRGPECHIRPNSEWVSREHCLLRVTEGGISVRDLGSANGTLVNGVRVMGECRLFPGDKLHVGPLVFEVYFDEAVPREPRPSTKDSERDTTLVNPLAETYEAPLRREQ